MTKIKKIVKNIVVCLLLIAIMLGGNFFWLSSSTVFADTLALYGTATEPTGLNNALKDDGATVTVNFTQPSLGIKGFSSSDLGRIDKVDVFFVVPTTSFDTAKGASTTWSLKTYYGPDTTIDVDTVATDTNQWNLPTTVTKSYPTKPNGQAWQWTDIQQIKLALETSYSKQNNTYLNVDAFYISISYTPTGDITPPTFSLSYYQDELLTEPLTLKDGFPAAGAKTVYVKAVPSEPLSENPVIDIEAPGTGNDISNNYMTYNSGGYYVFPWTVKAGEGDGLATITVTGKDQAATPNTGSSQGNVLIDTTVVSPQLNATAGNLKVDLSWFTTDTDIQEFKLYRSTTPNFTIGLDTLLQSFTGSTSSYTDTNVVVGQTYYYKLVSKDIAGNNSMPSTEVSATPLQDTTSPDFKVEFYKDPNFSSESKLNLWQDLPITKIQSVYLRIEADEDLIGNPTVTLSAPGTLNDITNQLTEAISSRVFRYAWNLQGGEQDGIADVFITGEDLFGNKTTDLQPSTGGKIQIDSTVSITQWTYGYPIGGLGYVDLDWLNADSDIKDYKVYRDIYSEFTIDQTNSTNLLLTLTGKSYRDTTATAPDTYYYKVMTEDYAGNNSISQEVYATPEKVNPHGYYTSSTDMCAQCHKAHGGNDKYNLKEKTKDVCYVCHDAGGQSINYVKGEMNLTGSHHPVDLASTSQPADTLSCSDCHNPHLEWETVSRLLTTRNNAISGNDVCFSCHGSSASGTQNKQSTYPTLGVGHNNNNWIAPNGLKPFAGEYTSPSTGTNIGCVGCHEEHGSSIKKLLRPVDWNSDSTIPGQNDKTFCYECHKNPLNTSGDNAWDGSTIYDSEAQLKHTGSGSQCTTCHDPHSTVNGNYLKSTYDISNRGTGRTKAYDPNDYSSCTKCHTKTTDLTDPAVNTGFTNIREDWPVDKQNLHYYHLNQLAAKGLGNAVCKECHRPHGTLSGENLTRTHLVGFPSTTISALTGNSNPIFEDAGDTGGNCTLVCHGVTHKPGTPQTGEVDSTYYGTAPSGGGLSNGGQDCASCHNNNTDTSRKLIDRMTVATGGFKHLIDATNSYSYLYDPNATNCLNTCHVDHDLFNNNMGANLRSSVNDTNPTAGVNTDYIGTQADGGICTSCHVNVVNKRYDTSLRGLFSKAVDPIKYRQSAHDYEVTTSFSYDNSSFRANCVKCHNDDMGKDSTNGTAVMSEPQFGMHESSYQFVLSPFSILSPPNPLGQKHCYGCHGSGGEYYKKTAAGDIEADFKKPYRHKIESRATWNYEDCKDCHDSHYAKSGNRLSGAGGATVDFSKVSPSMVGATGVYVTQWQAPTAPSPGTESLWSPADSTGYNLITIQESDPADYAALVCLKCHSSYVSTLPESVSATGERTKDKAKDFNPNNLSLHPIFAPRTDTRTLASTANRQSMLKAPWSETSPSAQMTCMDCHNADSDGSGQFGVHGSNNPFMLRAYGPQPGVSGGGTYDKLCYLCHIPTTSAFKSHLTSAHGSNDLGCLACHAGPAGKVAANNGGRRGSIHGSNFVWSSGTPAKTMLMGGYIADITGRNCTASGCATHTKAW